MGLKQEIRDFIHADALERFLRYIKVETTSDETNEGTTPSSQNQFDLAKILKAELDALGLENVELDEHCYVYATLPSNAGKDVEPIGFIAHVDTSSAVSGKDVTPIFHENYDGGVITYPKAPDLKLDPEEVPYLAECIGENIITPSGDTLLSADDKAGVAEIMAAMAAFKKFPELKHGELRVIFTPDEEIGAGTAKITMEKLPKFCYTVDGGEPGELEFECFDAYFAEVIFKGISVHPGFAKHKMVNAVNIIARYLADLPEAQAPENTEGRDGFFCPMELKASVEEASVKMIIRDFIEANNLKRIEYLKKLNELYEARYPGLKIEMNTKHQYENMVEVMKKHPNSLDLARKAIEATGLEVLSRAIRGGTDGSKLCQMGVPTPNLFDGGMLFHSRKEFIVESSLEKGAETIIHLAGFWTE